MKNPNKRELQQIAFDHSSDIDFVKSALQSQFFVVIDTTLASDNS